MMRAIFEGKEYIAQFIDGDVLLYDIASGEYVRNVVNPSVTIEGKK